MTEHLAAETANNLKTNMHKFLKYPMWLVNAIVWVVTLTIIVMVFILIYQTSQELVVLQDVAEGTSPVPQQAKESSQPTAIPSEPMAPIAQPAPQPVAASKLEILSTETGYLNVRSEASSKSQIVTKANPGETYEYTLKQGDWYQIKLKDGSLGWVSGKYIKLLN